MVAWKQVCSCSDQVCGYSRQDRRHSDGCVGVEDMCVG